MEINKNILVSSIGAAIVVIAGGVYANVRAMKKIKNDIKVIKNEQIALGIVNGLRDISDGILYDSVDSLNKKIDSIKKSNNQ